MEQSLLAFDEFPKVAGPDKTVMLLHGILSSGRNWQSFGRRLAKQLGPTWKSITIDLRNHGRSSKRNFAPPHNLSSAAGDLANLIRTHPNVVEPDILIGHSMGGRVALEFLRGCMEYGESYCQKIPKQVWVLDTYIGVNEQHDRIKELVSLIPALPISVPSKQWLMNRLSELGLSTEHAKWLASCARGKGTGTEECVWDFNPAGVTEMFKACREADYWDLLSHPPETSNIGIICGERSDICPGSDKERLETISRDGKIVYKVLGNAGHALHVDNPKGLLELLTTPV